MKRFFPILAIAVFTFCGTQYAHAAIALDTNGATINTGATLTNTLSLTISAGAALYVSVYGDGATPTTVTWNTTESLTQITSENSWTKNSIWYLSNPTATTANVLVTFSGATQNTVEAATFTGTNGNGANTTCVFSCQGSVTNQFMNITVGGTNSWIFSAATANNAAITGNSATVLESHANSGDGTNQAIGYQIQSTSVTFTVSYTFGSGTGGVLQAVEILEASTPPPTPSTGSVCNGGYGVLATLPSIFNGNFAEITGVDATSSVGWTQCMILASEVTVYSFFQHGNTYAAWWAIMVVVFFPLLAISLFFK